MPMTSILMRQSCVARRVRRRKCRQHTCFYARMRTFFSCTVHASLMFWLEGLTTQCVCAKVISSLCHVAVGCPCQSFSSECFLTHLFAVTTFSVVHTDGWNQKSTLHLCSMGGMSGYLVNPTPDRGRAATPACNSVTL